MLTGNITKKSSSIFATSTIYGDMQISKALQIETSSHKAANVSMHFADESHSFDAILELEFEALPAHVFRYLLLLSFIRIYVRNKVRVFT